MSLALKNVTFGYGDNPILENVSIDFEPGMITGVIGPNGAGKTTLLRLASGSVSPQSGEATLDGRAVSSYRARELARRMALVPQNSGMDYDFTVLDIVLTGRHAHINRLKGESEDDYAIAAVAMERVGILGLKDRSVTTLSGGEWQRMIIARAICQRSDIILLDEPVSNLDIQNQTGILQTLKRLVGELGITCVCVLHDLSLTMNYCAKVAVLGGRRLIECGEPRAVITRELISRVYGCDVSIIDDGAARYVLPKMGL